MTDPNGLTGNQRRFLVALAIFIIGGLTIAALWSMNRESMIAKQYRNHASVDEVTAAATFVEVETRQQKLLFQQFGKKENGK